MPQSQRLSPVIPFVAFERPACAKCKAPMMLVSIELARPGVDLHTFECAICNHMHTTLAAHEDPMKSKPLDAGFKAICTHPGKARRSEPADFVILEGLAPAKRPLIDIAMSAQCREGNCRSPEDGKLNLEMDISP